MTLSEPGWPRPTVLTDRFGVLPVPWISPPARLGNTDPDRHAATMTARLCQVCGQPTWNEEEVWVFVNEGEPPKDPDDKLILAMDDAVLHPYCARLALGHCPILRSLFGAQKLIVYKCLGADIEVVYDHSPEADGQTPRHAVDLQKAEMVE